MGVELGAGVYKGVHMSLESWHHRDFSVSEKIAQPPETSENSETPTSRPIF